MTQDLAPDSHIQALRQSLTLPGAQLQIEYLADIEQHLWLLAVDDALQLDAAAIGEFWQNLPYWAFAWAGGYALARYIRQRPELVAGKRVLDFGCGSGLVAIAAAQAGAREVWIADIDKMALMAAQANARLNSVLLHPVDHDWPEFDVLLAADVLYDISSESDLHHLMQQTPEVCLAESRHIAEHRDVILPHGLRNVATFASHTLPTIGDFDEDVAVTLYHREQLC